EPAPVRRLRRHHGDPLMFLKNPARAAAALTCFQVLFCLALAPKTQRPTELYRVTIPSGFDLTPRSTRLHDAYLRLNNWDSLHFFEIARNGYHLSGLGQYSIHDY